MQNFRELEWMVAEKNSFWGIFDPFWPPGGLTRFIFKNRRMSLCNLAKVTTSCKISEKLNGWSRRKIRTNGRTNGHASKHKSPSINRGTKNWILHTVSKSHKWALVIFFKLNNEHLKKKWGIFYPFWPPGGLTRFVFKNRIMSLCNLP